MHNFYSTYTTLIPVLNVEINRVPNCHYYIKYFCFSYLFFEQSFDVFFIYKLTKTHKNTSHFRKFVPIYNVLYLSVFYIYL
jgi:hypothetical protein